jgi:hypothetical protein
MLQIHVQKKIKDEKIPDKEMGQEESSSNEAICVSEQSEPYRRRISATEFI